MFSDWLTTTQDAWTIIWDKFINFLPNLIGAVIILIIGWLVGMLVAVLLDRLFRIIGLQTLFEKAKLEDLLKKSDVTKDSTALLASVSKWIIYVVAFIAAANILQLTSIADFLDRILNYLPQVIAAGAILLIGLILANFLGFVIKGALRSSGLGLADTISVVTRYAIIIFAFLAAIAQLGIAQTMLNTLFIGLVAFLAIAGGLSFGLGGQSTAKEWLENFKKQLK